jgi:hypothetical protein
MRQTKQRQTNVGTDVIAMPMERHAEDSGDTRG